VGGCSFTVSKRGVTGAGTNLDIALYGHVLGAGGGALGVDENFDCNPQNGKGLVDANQGAAAPSIFYGEFGTPGTPVYRRTDNPNNQNVYKAPVDTGLPITNNLMLTRGNAAAYLVKPTKDGTASAIVGSAAAGATPTEAITVDTTLGYAAGGVFFVNGKGPMVASAVVANAATSLTVGSTGTGFGKFFPFSPMTAVAQADVLWPVMSSILVATTDKDDGAATSRATAAYNVAAGSVLLLDGRRYRVKSRGTGDGIDGVSKVTLSENYAGGSLEKVCTSCVAVHAAGSLKTFKAASVGSAGALLNLVPGDTILQADNLHGDKLTTVATGTGPSTTYTLSKGGAHGTSTTMGADMDLTAEAATAALYKTRYGAMGAPGVTLITEVAAGSATYQYVAQCSNRGTCDGSTGVCKCFKGYANDNCDRQNMLAM
jgi:hypothetical protein